MTTKSFFNAKYFSPAACKVLAKYCSRPDQPDQHDVTLKFYIGVDENVIQYDIAPQKYVVFLPNNLLMQGKFGKISGDNKHKILQITLSEKDLMTLITQLGGSIKKRSIKIPTIGDLMK